MEDRTATIPLTPFLEDLEARIDPEVEEGLERAWRRFALEGWPEPVFAPARPALNPSRLDWPAISVNRALANGDAMALQQLGMCSRLIAAGGGNLLMVRCNYGTGLLPSLFGAELYVMDEATNTLPTTRPLTGGAETMRRLVARGMPDLRAGLGGRVFDMAERFQSLLAPYPKLSRFVSLYHPDLQGPMDVAELLGGSSLFLAIVDEPELVHETLALITDTYIAFLRAWERQVPPRDSAVSLHWGWMHRGRVMLRDDSAMNFSPAMYEEFIRPYDQRILDAFGGGAIHFCGRGDHYIGAMTASRGLYAIAMSQPELNDMEIIYRNTVDRGVRLLGLPLEEVRRAQAAGRPFRGYVHCDDPSRRPVAAH